MILRQCLSSFRCCSALVSPRLHMTIALVLKYRHRLLMTLNPKRLRNAVPSPIHKRPISSSEGPLPSEDSSSSPSTSFGYSQKVPRFEGSGSPGQSSAVLGGSSKMSHTHHPHASSSGRGDWKHSRGSGSSRNFGRLHSEKKANTSSKHSVKGKASKPPIHPPLTGPLHDEAYIEKTYMVKTVKQEWKDNPKSPLSNYMLAVHNQPPHLETTTVSVGDARIFR